MSELQRTKFDELEKMEARITEQLKDIKESLKHELKITSYETIAWLMIFITIFNIVITLAK